MTSSWSCFFFFNDTATTEIYTLSLHDALPSCASAAVASVWLSKVGTPARLNSAATPGCGAQDRKSTRLNSSHTVISYAVFCLKKKKTKSSRIQFRRKQDKQ